MRINREALLLYAVTGGDEATLPLTEQVREAVKGGAGVIQLREKGAEEAELIEKAKEIAAVCKELGAVFIVNDSIKAAKEAGADGVHLGREDGKIREAREVLGSGAIIGATAHNLSEALEAEKEGADYLGSGAAFGSPTKKDARPILHEEYNRITEAVKIPVVAIGGIHIGNVEQLYGRGLAGVAVVSGIFSGTSIRENTRKLKDKLVKEFY